MNLRAGHALGFTSARAGAGKTTIVTELAAWLAARGHAVALLDADLGASDALGRLGLEGASGRALDVACFSLGRALEARGLAGLAGELLEQELARLLEQELDLGRPELVLVDLAPGAENDEAWLEALGIEALVEVAREDEELAFDAPRPLLGRIESFARELVAARGPRGATLLGRVPVSDALRRAAARGRPLVLENARDPAALALAQAGAQLEKRVRSRLSG